MQLGQFSDSVRFENVALAGKGNFLVSPGMLNIVFIVGSTCPY